jgi:O-antigen/teichoic acid export membrane protein
MLVGRVGVLAGQWGVLVLLARLAGVETLGQYGLGLALCAPIFAMFDARLPSVLATGTDSDTAPTVYLRLRVLAAGLALAACVLLAAAGYGPVAAVTVTVALIATAKASESISTLVHGLLQKHDRMETVGQSLLLVNVAAVMLAAAALGLTGSFVLALAGVAVARLLVLVGFDLPHAAALPGALIGTVSSGALRALAWSVAPLSALMLLKSLSSALPRLVLETSAGRAELGYFTALASFLVAATAVSTALCQAAGPRLARALSQDRGRFRAQLLRLLAVSAGLGVIGVVAATLAGGPLLHMVYGEEYAGFAAALAWLMVAATALHVRAILGTALIAMRRLRSQTVIAAITVTVAAVTSVALIPTYGLAGAVATAVATATVSAITAATVLSYAWVRAGGAS